MIIHKEGRRLLLVLLVALIFFNGLIYFFLSGNTIVTVSVVVCSMICFLLVLQFFRSPTFKINRNEHHILAPADGKVVVVEEVQETEYLKERRIQISIFMSPLNVHVNRIPVGGEVTYCQYHAGKYRVAWHPKSSLENERTSIAFKTQNGTEILVRQIAGTVARRIKYYVSVGQAVQQGKEFGFIKFGSRVDVFLPPDAVIKVNRGDKTTGGKTVLAEF